MNRYLYQLFFVFGFIIILSLILQPVLKVFIKLSSLVSEPPKDNGGAEITKYIVEIDDGRGTVLLTLLTLSILLYVVVYTERFIANKILPKY